MQTVLTKRKYPPKIYRHRKIVHLSDRQLRAVEALKTLSEFKTGNRQESNASVIRAGLDLLVHVLNPIVEGLAAAIEMDADDETKQKEMNRVYLNHLPLLEKLLPPEGS